MSEMTQAMKKFFEKAIGRTASETLVTGDSNFCSIYARQYTAMIVAIIGEDKVMMSVESYDKVPSGYKDAETDKKHDDVVVSLDGTPQTITRAAIRKADPKMFDTYPNADWR